MTRINLLSWREQKREQEKKTFMIFLLGTVLIAFFIVLLINLYAVNLVSKQKVRNQIIQKEIFVLDDQIKKIKKLRQSREILVSRITVVQKLQSARALITHLFAELSKIIPSGIYLTIIERQNDLVSLWGYAESNTDISLLMKKIEANEWIRKPVLSEIKKLEEKSKHEGNKFHLNFVLGTANERDQL